MLQIKAKKPVSLGGQGEKEKCIWKYIFNGALGRENKWVLVFYFLLLFFRVFLKGK